ncbi:MAG: 2Fe-2S iron-sulfur cluster-binding protein, partial [Chloroflexota bacterium]|nr:2Fe-2S iron-sulfur cluster-binding protein [Chloroflexota bacterium]
MADDITISFDGQEVKTQPGKMVLEAAIEAGVYVPYLCYHPGMKPFAACRMCVISVEGQRGFPTSCTMPVADGMKVQTASTEVNDLRRSVMEMIIAEHPNGCLTCHRVDICGPTDVCLRHVSVNDRCVTCPKNERCELKDTVRYLGMSLESPLQYKYREIPLEVADPFYDRDYNLCIVCGRCVNACEQLRGDDAIAFTMRSGQALVGTSFGTSLLESGCEFCGACIDVCPVGALVERDHKWDKPRKVERTICPLCPVGCQMNVEYDGDGTLIRVVPEINSPANHGQACFKGKFGLQFVNDTSRLHIPLVRRDGQLVEATWDEAL